MTEFLSSACVFRPSSAKRNEEGDCGSGSYEYINLLGGVVGTCV